MIVSLVISIIEKWEVNMRKKINIYGLIFLSVLVFMFLHGCNRHSNNTTTIPTNQNENYKTVEPEVKNNSEKIVEYRDTFEKKWNYKPAYSDFEPVIDGSNVYVYGDGFTCLDRQTGEVKWILDTVTGPIDTKIAYDSTVVAFTNGEALIILDKTTGNVVTKYETSKETYSNPVINGNVVFFTASEGELYGVDKETGELVWEFYPDDGMPNMSILSSPVIIDNKIFFEASNNLYAVDLLSKKEIWRTAVLNLASSYVSIFSSNDYIFIIGGMEHNNIYCIDCNNGSVIWEKVLDKNIYANEILINDGYVYICSQDNYIYKIDKYEGSILYEYETKSNSEKLYDIALKDKRIFFTNDKGLFSIDTSGENYQKHEISNVIGKKIIFEGDELYLISKDNDLCKYDGKKNFNLQESEEQINMIQEREGIYGMWEFSKPVTIYGLSPEATIEYMGKQFTYMQDFCRCGISGLNNPQYSIEKLEKENFNEELKQFLDNNSIEKNYVTSIKIFKDNEKQDEWEGLGNEFYKIDDRIIVNIDGKLCELKRIFSGKVDNYLVDKNSIQTGQKIGSLTVKSVDKVSEAVNDITFSGEIHVKGIYEWCDTGDGYGCIITLDENSREIIPVFEDFANEKSIKINNTEMAKELLTKETGEAEIVIDNYSIGERQIMVSADIVRLD